MLATKMFKFETIRRKIDKIFPSDKSVRVKLNEVVKAVVGSDMPLIDDGELPSPSANQLTICGVTFRFLERKD